MTCGVAHARAPLSTSNPPVVHDYLLSLLETMDSVDIPRTPSGACSSSAWQERTKHVLLRPSPRTATQS